MACTGSPAPEVHRPTSPSRRTDDPGPGVNWLDTKGRRETILLAPYLLPEDELPPITTRVVSI